MLLSVTPLILQIEEQVVHSLVIRRCLAFDVGDRDESVFPEPDRLDVHLEHDAFNHGGHELGMTW
jgi:hypothetical protein